MPLTKIRNATGTPPLIKKYQDYNHIYQDRNKQIATRFQNDCLILIKVWCVCVYKSSKLADRSRGWFEGYLFNSYYTEVYGRTLLLSLGGPLTLDPYLIMLSAKQAGIKYRFLSFGITRPGIESRSPVPLASTLTIMHIYICFVFFV